MEEEAADSFNRTSTVLPPIPSGHYEVSFLEAPATPTPQTSHIEILGSGDAEVIEATFKSPDRHDSLDPHRDLHSISSAVILGSSKTPTDTHTARVQLPITSSEPEELLETGFESDVFARSTMEDALASPAKFPTQSPGDISSDGSRDTSPVRRAEPEILSRSSRALIKEYFTEATAIRLAPGHPTFALNEGQICNIQKAVANESARVSFDMLDSVVEKAKRLNLGECSHGLNLCSHSGRRNPLFVTDSETDLPTRESSTTRGGFTSDTAQAVAALVHVLATLDLPPAKLP